MDLNHFYSQHQVALIRASAATDRRARSRHLADAALIGEHIRYHQVSKGAAAARSWRAASAAVVATPDLSACTRLQPRPLHPNDGPISTHTPVPACCRFSLPNKTP